MNTNNSKTNDNITESWNIVNNKADKKTAEWITEDNWISSKVDAIIENDNNIDNSVALINSMLKNKDFSSFIKMIGDFWTEVDFSSLELSEETKDEIVDYIHRYFFYNALDEKIMQHYEESWIFNLISKSKLINKIVPNAIKNNGGNNQKLKVLFEYSKNENIDIMATINEELANSKHFININLIEALPLLTSKENINEELKNTIAKDFTSRIKNKFLWGMSFQKYDLLIDVNSIIKENFLEQLENENLEVIDAFIDYNFWWESIDLNLNEVHLDKISSLYSKINLSKKLKKYNNFFSKYFDANELLAAYFNKEKKENILSVLSLIKENNYEWSIELKSLEKYFNINQYINEYIDFTIKENPNNTHIILYFLNELVWKYQGIFDMEEIKSSLNSPKNRLSILKTFEYSNMKNITIEIISKNIDLKEAISELIETELNQNTDGLDKILEKSWLKDYIINYAKKDISNFIKIWTHDNLLFLQHFKELGKEERENLCEYVIKPIFNQITDLRVLNELLWYFDINKYKEENWEEEITSFKKFESIANIHKYDVDIPKEANKNWREAIENLLAAPWINIAFVKELLRNKFPNNKELVNDRLYFKAYEDKDFIENQESFSNSDLNNLFDDYKKETKVETNNWYDIIKSKRFWNLDFKYVSNFLSRKEFNHYEEFFSALEEVSSCTIVKMEKNEDSKNLYNQLKVVFEDKEYRVPEDDFKSITWYNFQEFITKYNFKVKNTTEYISNNNDFALKLIDIIDWVDKINERQMIPTFSETFSIDNVNEIVFNALWIFPFNQDTVKYSRLFKENKNFVEIINFFKNINEEQKKKLYESKERDISLYPHRKDYYTAKYNKEINHDTILNFADWWNLKWINYQKSIDIALEWDEIKNLKEVINNLLLDPQAKKVIINTLKNIDQKSDKVKQNIELSNFKELTWLHSILENYNESNSEELLSQIEWKEVILASFLMYLWFNNLTRQSQSGNIKKEIEKIINQEKYKSLLQEKWCKKPTLVAYIDWELDVESDDTDKIIEILQKFNFYKKVNSIKAEIVKKSDSRGWVSGNHTNCCMPLETRKNQEYLLREDIAYFIISLVDENNEERIIAQSVLVAAGLEWSENFDTLAIDNIEVANNAIKYNSHLEKAYSYIKEKFNDKKIIIGTTYNDDGGVITGNCKMEELKDYPINWPLDYSDCFQGNNVYLFNSNEIDNNKYQNYWLSNYNLNSTILKKYLWKEKLQETIDILDKIWAWEDDWDGWLSFPDNYSRIITKDEKLLGFVVAADYLVEDQNSEAFTFEDISFINEISDEDKVDIIENYLKENKVIERFNRMKIKKEIFDLLPPLKNFELLDDTNQNYLILKINKRLPY